MYKVLCFICLLWPLAYSQAAHNLLPVGGDVELRIDTSEKEGRLIADAGFWIGPPDQSSSMKLLIISAGKKVEVKSEYKGYYKVWHRNLIGYIDKDFIEIITPVDRNSRQAFAVKVKTEKESAPSSKTVKKKDGAYYRLTKETSLRTGPDSQERVILRFRAGDEVEVLDDSGYWWWQVRFRGETGWAKKALLEEL